MSVRGSRVLVVGATTRAGHGIVEALLALGAQVIATGAVRTELDQLAAEMHQHERLQQADVDPTSPQGLERLLADVVQAGKLDTIVLAHEAPTSGVVVPTDPQRALRAMVESTFDSTCWVLRTGVAAMANRGGGRIVVLTDGSGEPDPAAPIRAAVASSVRTLIESNQAPLAGQGIGLVGLSTRAFAGRPAALAERVLELIDPEHALPAQPFV